MSGKRLKAAPTKNTLLNLKRQLQFLEDGHSLLERKRELLTRLVYQRISEYREIRDKAHQSVKLAYHWLSMLQLRMSSRALHQAALGVSLLLSKMGEVSMSLSRLIAEQRKAQKRVNALRYNIIPKYRNTIRFIENALEEEERNALFQVKVLREQERI
ncbi:MAG: V-type ATP synthase subunit D [Candidatus Thiodiazotropha sp.]